MHGSSPPRYLDVGTWGHNLVHHSSANSGLGDCGTATSGSASGDWGPISHQFASPGTYTACVVIYDVPLVKTFAARLRRNLDTTRTTFRVDRTPPITNGEVLLIGSEQMLVTAVSGSHLTVTRHVNGTTAAPHAQGRAVRVIELGSQEAVVAGSRTTQYQTDDHNADNSAENDGVCQPVTFTVDDVPTVSSTIPTDTATGVDPGTTITVNFNEPVNAPKSAFTLECPTGTPESFSVSSSPAQSYTITPDSSLPGGVTCSVTVVASGVTSAASSIPMASDYPFSFTTTPASNSAPTDISLDNSSIDENQQSGVDVGTLTTTDPDAGDTATYTLESSGCGGGPFPDNSSFQIGGGSGDKLQSATGFDFEKQSSYTVCVRTTDSGSLSYDEQFTISVTDVNEGPTDISLDNNSIEENEPSGTNVGTLTTTDPDSGDTATYTLEDTGCGGGPFEDNSSFQISGDSLQSSASFDYETQSSYTVCVRTTDSGSLSLDKPFTISVTDVNEAPTDIQLDNSSIAENEPSATDIGTLTTTDPDAGATATYTIESSGCGGGPYADSISFQISGDKLQSSASFDYETRNSYTICVRTTDGGSLSYDKQFAISVTDVNEAPTDIGIEGGSIAENQPSGTGVGSFTTTDPDSGDTASYTLENAGCGGSFPDTDSFQLSGDSLQSAASFDYETQSSYTICVRTTDSGSLSYDKLFTISVTDVNDAPTDISLSESTIDENKASGSAVGNLSATDQDAGQTHGFALQSAGCGGGPFPDNSSFQISGNNLKSAATFNFEVKNSYTICVRTTDNGSPNLSFDKQLTIDINDVNDAPADGNESANAVGNTLLEYGSVASPSSAAKKTLTGSLLDNASDEDQPAQTLSISASDATSAHGGSVSVSSSGAFSYVPAAGYTGEDSFNYTVSDGNGGTDTSTVNITVASRVWYVKNNATAGGTGRSTDPFDTLGEADTAANATGDITYVYKGDGTTTGLTGGFSLLANQKLLGEPVALVVGSDTLASGTPANRPSLSGTVALASGSRVEGVNIAGSAGAAIAGTNTGGSDVTNVNLSGAAGGVALTGAAAGTFTFTNFAITTTGGTGFLVNTSGAPTISVGSASTENVSATSGPAVDVRNANTASALSFDAVSSSGSAGAGINLDSNGATTFSAASGSISGAAGNAIDINAGSGAITYPGTLGNGGGNTADITNRTGGAISLSGDINDTNDAGGGITMSGNSGGTTTFSGTTKTLNTGASAAFSSTGSAHTITFSGGGLTITTTSGAGFSATGGGTVNVTGTVNTISSTTGTALNVSSTNIGASGLTFQSISSNGGTNGIVLNATGASGSLTVSGTGSASSGGTIQNTTGHGIALTNTLSPSFTDMNIHDTAGSGINGTQVSGFTFASGTINNSGTGGAADDSNISFNDSSANANVTGAVSITNSSLTNSRYHGVDIQNSTGTLSSVTITGNTFTSSTSVASSLGSAVRLIALGTAGGVANVTKANLDNNAITNFPSGAGFVIQGGNAADVGGAPAGTMGTPGSGTNIISIDGNTMDGGLGGIGNQPDRFVTAVVNGRGQGNFDISSNGTVASPIKHIDGVVIELSEFGDAIVTATTNSNRIAANNAVGSSGIGIGCDADSLTTTGDTGTLTTTINSNNVSLTDGPGIFAIARNSSCTMKAKIQNNTVAAPATTSAARAGIRVDSGSAAGNTTVCLNISGNTTFGSTNTGTATTSPGINLRKQGTVSTTNAFAINGMAATATPNVENYVNGLNTSASGTFGVGGTALLSATSGFSNCSLP